MCRLVHDTAVDELDDRHYYVLSKFHWVKFELFDSSFELTVSCVQKASVCFIEWKRVLFKSVLKIFEHDKHTHMKEKYAFIATRT